MTAILYGIKNCDTVKKARQWLEQHGIEYRFHDFRANGVDRAQVESWIQEVGLDDLINRRGTTWKQLDESTRTNFNAHNAATQILAQPALIKRPLLDIGHQRFIGFSADRYATIFTQHTL
jgi:Spx/MgsR family transcriptional regulator